MKRDTETTRPGSRGGAQLRSAQWYSGDDRNTYIHRAWMRRGVPDSAFAGRPQIAIANTASDLTPCNAHLTEVAASVKNGVYEAGGIPLELPVVSLGETLVRPTAMLWRKHGGDGDRGDAAGQPDRRRGAARRVRQDDPVAADGRRVGRPARGGRAGRTDAHRHLPRRSARLRDRCVAAVGGGPGRHAVRRAVHPLRVGDDPQPGPLQHDGDGVDDGAGLRGAGHGAARTGRDAGPGQPAARSRARDRPAGRGDGRRRPPAEHVPDQGVVRQRDRGPGRDRRVDQRGRAPAGDRRPGRDRPDPGRLRPHRLPGPGAGRPAARGPVPDGRLPPGRRSARGAAGGSGPARPDGPDR